MGYPGDGDFAEAPVFQHFSDFVTRYTAGQFHQPAVAGPSEYYALEEDDGLTMNLGINPLLQFGLEETRAELCRNILTALSVVNYVPFDSDTIAIRLWIWGMC